MQTKDMKTRKKTLKNDIASQSPKGRKKGGERKEEKEEGGEAARTQGAFLIHLAPSSPNLSLSRLLSLSLSSLSSLQNHLASFHANHCIATLGLTALNTVRCTLDSGLERLVVSGNRIAELWNCFVASRLQSAAGTVAVLMICSTCERARCLEPISA